MVNEEREEEVLQVNAFFRGVRVQPGDTKVVFSYVPTSFRHGLMLGFTGVALWALCAIALLVGRFIQRKTPSLESVSSALEHK